MEFTDTYHILSVVGARPQFIKLAALQSAICRSPHLQHTIVHSGQHYDAGLSQSFFDEFALPAPKYHLNIGSTPHNIQIADTLKGLDAVLAEETPDMVLIYGDTNTTAAAAIAAAKRNIPVAHIEAGLREFDKAIPEEINKYIADALSDLWFAPTATAIRQLQSEGKKENVFLTGDIVLDLLYDRYGTQTVSPHTRSKYALLTCHRASNTDNPERLLSILSAVHQLPMQIIFPVHPRTRNAINLVWPDFSSSCPHVTVTTPAAYWQTQEWIRQSTLVLTDSGGLIKEAYFHRTPCIIIDTQTEWKESLDEGWAVLAGYRTKDIINAVSAIKVPADSRHQLGSGQAGRQIVGHLLSYLRKSVPRRTHTIGRK